MKFQMQADLIDVSALKKFDDGFKYIVALIDVFSQVVYVECNKNKTSNSMISAFCALSKKSSYFQKLKKNQVIFKKLQADRGSEFLNKPFRTWLKKQKIELFNTHNYDTNAAIVERFNRTLKDYGGTSLPKTLVGILTSFNQWLIQIIICITLLLNALQPL